MKIYIDFDGVILDTAPVLFKEWLEKYELINVHYEERIEYMNNKSWEEVLNESQVINNSLDNLKKLDIKNSAILTKVHSLINEQDAKIRYLRANGVEQEVIAVPYSLKKIDIVPVKGNILIDDLVSNLDEWSSAGGIPIFFDKNKDGIDDAKRKNTTYKSIKSLDEINNIMEEL